MHAAGFGVDHARQFVGVGAFKFGDAAIVENNFWQRMIFGEFRERFFIGAGRAAGGFLEWLDALFVEQNFSELLRRAKVKRLARFLMRLGL